jgi:hypothetical protein
MTPPGTRAQGGSPLTSATRNASNAETAQLILSRVSAIEFFHEHPEAGFLLLEPDL